MCVCVCVCVCARAPHIPRSCHVQNSYTCDRLSYGTVRRRHDAHAVSAGERGRLDALLQVRPASCHRIEIDPSALIIILVCMHLYRYIYYDRYRYRMFSLSDWTAQPKIVRRRRERYCARALRRAAAVCPRECRSVTVAAPRSCGSTIPWYALRVRMNAVHYRYLITAIAHRASQSRCSAHLTKSGSVGSSSL